MLVEAPVVVQRTAADGRPYRIGTAQAKAYATG